MGRRRSKKERRQKRGAKKGNSGGNVAVAAATTTASDNDPFATVIEDEARPNGIQIAHMDGDDGDGVGWLYSYNHGNGNPEFYVPDVPKSKVNSVMDTITAFSKLHIFRRLRLVHGCGGSFTFWAHLVEGERKKELLQTKCLMLNNSSSAEAPLYELRPLFECSVHDSWWGCKIPTPDGREEVADAILEKWLDQRSFSMHGHWVLSDYGSKLPQQLEWIVRFLNQKCNDEGSTFPSFDCSGYKEVDLACALRHIDDWEVDWDKNLTVNEVQYVREHKNYFRRLAKAMFRDFPICEACGTVELNLLSKCSRCHSAHYCSQTCQKVHWKKHKERCTCLKEMRNKKPPQSITITGMTANDTKIL